MKYEAKNYHKTQGIGTYNTQQDHIRKKTIHDHVFEKNKLSIPDGNEKIKDMSQIMFSILISLKLYFKTHHWYQQSF